jgi:hypothetical protein
MSVVTGALGREVARQLRDEGRCLQDMPDPAWCANCICGVRAKHPDVEAVTAGQTSLLEEPYPTVRGGVTGAHYPARCRCRPGCLSAIETGDEICRVDDGWALLEHTRECDS